MSLSNILYTIILYPLVQIIEISYKLFDKLFSNTGLSVIGVSLTVTLLCLPLYIVAEKWQQLERNTQSSMKAGIERIKSTFKGDEQYMILSTFYKQHHYHPMMALRSSFGLLIQIPFFMAAYSCLSNMQALKGQGFLFIQDMGQQDALFHIGSFPINVLPIAMTLINIIAGAIYTKGFPFREKAQIYGMAILFLAVLYGSPSGLVLYWTMNNVFSLVKNIFYKLKNPIKVLYSLMLFLIIFLDIYILFFYSGAAGHTKRLIASIALTSLLAIPLVIKLLNWIVLSQLKALLNNTKNRIILYILSASALTILLGVLLPSNILSSSVQEFSNIGKYSCPNELLLNPFFQALGIFIFWGSCIFFLFGNKIQTTISFFYVVILICGLVNTYAFMSNYGTMDITLKFIEGFKSQPSYTIIINILATFCIIISIISVIKVGKTKILNYLIGISIFGFIFISTVNIMNTKRQYDIYNNESKAFKNNTDFTTKYSLSRTHPNVIVMMLDRAESSYIEDMFEFLPSLKSSFDGFEYYKNTVSYNGHTLIGAPPLFGGYEYTPFEMNKRSSELLKDKHNEALLVMPRIFSENAGFDVVVNDLSWANYSYYSDISFISEDYPDIKAYKLQGSFSGEFKKEFAVNFSNTISLESSLERNLLFVSLFRISPVILRPVIYYKGSWWNTSEATDLDSFIDGFSTLYYLRKITSFNNLKPSFIMFTNDATHSGENISFLDITGGKTVTEGSGYANILASLNSIGKWFDCLKENDVWDNTRIIIVADHGIGSGKKASEGYDTPDLHGYSKDHLHPLLMVKDFNSKGPLTINNDFMTTADVPSIAFKELINNPLNPFTNKNIEKNKMDGVYITIEDLSMPDASRSKNIFTVKDSSWYHIKDNIFIDSNWKQEVPNE